MAQLYPGMKQINRLRVKPTDGEIYLLHFLTKELDDTYEIYFQPFLNGDRPDLIVMRKGYGVLIFEVKDWDLDSYYIGADGEWRLKRNGVPKKSPLRQVADYKQNLYDLHVVKLLDEKLKNLDYWAIVQTCVYFHCADEATARNFCINDRTTERVRLLGKNSLNRQSLQRLLEDCRLEHEKRSKYFSDPLYENFKRTLSPSVHEVEDGKPLTYTPKQKRLTDSNANIQQKVRGVAGSGKTYVLAKRAVNAHIRTGKRVLILTFNITLRNYIHDRISEVREQYTWDAFYIIHYHLFIKLEANNYNIHISKDGFLAACDNELLFEPVKDEIEKYDAIFIDEIQDYKSEWVKLIRRYFLAEGGEFVVFGDENQNIYGRAMDGDRRPWIGIGGAWNQLNESHRLPSRLAQLALAYQFTFLEERYLSDENIEIMVQPSLLTDNHGAAYLFLRENEQRESLFETIIEQRNSIDAHANDVTVLSTNVEFVRLLEQHMCQRNHERTTTMFETQEQWEKLQNKLGNTQKFNMEIEGVRRNRKYNFWMNAGTTKLSTIHSFKGWDSPVVFVIIQPNFDQIEADLEEEDFSIEELIYVAITRCRSRLIILNWGNTQFHQFFQTAVEKGLAELLPTPKGLDVDWVPF